MNYSQYTEQGALSNFMYRVYGWMALGLVVTAAIAYYVSTVPHLSYTIATKPMLLIGIFIFQLALVMVLSFFIFRMNFFLAFACYLLYAATLGVTLSSIFLVYEMGSIYITFLVTALMFGVMCLYGYFTKSDLTSIGSMGMMALIGIIIASLVNLYFKSSTMDYIISGIGVLIFTLLTAYDSQKIKQMGQQLMHDQEGMAKVALLGALTLYLDFINLFLFLLRFLGKRRD
jgi:FtsH-binding integral membrane protein